MKTIFLKSNALLFHGVSSYIVNICLSTLHIAPWYEQILNQTEVSAADSAMQKPKGSPVHVHVGLNYEQNI